MTDEPESEGTSTSRVDVETDGVDDVVLDPWGSSTISDYEKLFADFGIETFDDLLESIPNPHYLMRRGVIFGHRDYRPIIDAIRNDSPAAVLSGFMPTGDPHIGHKLVFDEIIWHQQQGIDAYGLIADLEAHSARGLSWEEIDTHTENYLLSLLALGFDPAEGELYRQSTNTTVQKLAFELGIEANYSELQSIYGFDGETDISHMQSVVTQMADILYPQLDGPKPTVIPVGPDQDPHMRLARDLATRMRSFKVTKAFASFELTDEERDIVATCYEYRTTYAADPDQPRCVEAATWLTESTPQSITSVDESVLDSTIEKLEAGGKEPLEPRIRFFDRRASPEAFEALIESIEGNKRVYEGHIDAFDLEYERAGELARSIEVDHGGYGFLPPSSIYHRFMTGLTGGKMSSSIPESHISLLDEPETGYEKVKSATTGGRETAELQRELGGRADECPVYELYAYLLTGDDDEFTKLVYDECVGGERLCGDCKEQAATLMKEFLSEHQQKREEVRPLLEEADIQLESDRR